MNTVNREMNNDRAGMFSVFLSSICFSIGGLCVKMIPWSPLAINGARNLIGAGVIGVFILLTHHEVKVNKPVIIGALSTIGVTTLFAVSNKLTTAANAIILQYTAPVFVILFMAVIFHVRPAKRDVVTCIAVFAGICIFFVDGLKTGNVAGDIAAVLSGVCYAGVFMMNTARGADPVSSCFLGQLTSGIIFTPLCLNETVFTLPVLSTVFILGVVQVGLAYLFLTYGISRIDPVAGVLITSMEPILNPVWVALFYGETISPLSAAGAVIVFGAVVMYNISRARETS